MVAETTGGEVCESAGSLSCFFSPPSVWLVEELLLIRLGDCERFMTRRETNSAKDDELSPGSSFTMRLSLSLSVCLVEESTLLFMVDILKLFDERVYMR